MPISTQQCRSEAVRECRELMHNVGMDTTKVWLTTPELAEYTGLPVPTIYAKNSRGEGPRRYRVGRGLRYRRSEVDKWMESHLVESGQPASA